MGLFGKIKSAKTIWRGMAPQLDAEFVDRGLFKTSYIMKKFEVWRIYMNYFSSKDNSYTRVLAPYIATREFKFDIHHKNILSALGKIFGAQDIEIGDPYFDREYIVKSNDEGLILSLLGNRKIIELIQKLQPPMQFILFSKKVKKLYGMKFPPQTWEIYFQQSGVITEIERMKLIIEIFKETLMQLYKIGIAEKQSPYENFERY